MKNIKRIFIVLCSVLLTVHFLYAQNNEQSDAAYKIAYNKLNSMLAGESPLSFEEAIFTIENAYCNNQLSKTEFTNTLDFHTKRIFELATANKDKVSDITLPDRMKGFYPSINSSKKQLDLLLNWAIFTYITDTTRWVENGNLVAHYPMQYATQDPYGIKNWKHTQITTLLNPEKGTGNCFSLAALYKIFSDRFNSEAYLVTVPQHIYIQHKGYDDAYHNIELATASFPGSGTIKTLTYTTHEAVSNGIAMKRLNDKESVALCLVYLAKGYERKIKNEELKIENFEAGCVELILQYDSTNLSALLLKAQLLERVIKNKGEKITENGLSNSDEVEELKNALVKLYALGYDPIPGKMQEMLIAQMQNTKVEETNFNIVFPFQTIDNNIHYNRLSKGQYPEMHTATNLYTINGVCLNRQTGKICFNENTNLAIENSIDPVVFALSIDPLAQKFPSMSPYNSMNNNPMLFIDPTGEAALTANQLKTEADKRTDVQEGTVALFTLSNMLKPGDNVSGSEIVKALPADFKSKSPLIYTELKRIKSVTNTDGYIKVETTDGNPLVFGEEGSGFIIVQNNATFKVSTDGNTLKMSSVKNIILSDNRKGEGMLSSTALQSAVIDKKGNAALDGMLKDGNANLGKVVTGQ